MRTNAQPHNVGTACWDNMPHSIRSRILDLAIPPYSGPIRQMFCSAETIELAALSPYFCQHGAVFQLDRSTREVALALFFAENDVAVFVDDATPLYMNQPAVRFGYFRMRTLRVNIQLCDDWQLGDFVPLLSHMVNLRHLQILAITGQSAELVPRTDWAAIDNILLRVGAEFRRVVKGLESVHIIFPEEVASFPYDDLIGVYLARAFIMKAQVEEDGWLSYIVKRAIRKAQMKIAIDWPKCNQKRRYLNEPFC